MMSRTKQKTVKPEAENRSIFGRIKGIFRTKTSEEAISQKRDYHQTTEQQIRKMFKLQRDNPKLSYCDIAKAVNVSEAVCRYWLKQNEDEVISLFKVKRGRKVIEKPKEITVKKEPKSATTTNLSNEQAQKNLDILYATEKYPVEHQADSRYFSGVVPPQAVATVEAFKDQKRRNNINRVNTAKLLHQKKENELEEQRKDRLERKHKNTEMKIHLDCCPSCNRDSNLTVSEYNSLVYKEYKREKEWSMRNAGLKQREKEIELKEREHSVAELAKQGTKLCKVCDSRLSYSQATRSFQVFDNYYCQDHEPK